MIELPRLIAVRFEQELPSGTTKPCVFACEDSEGNGAGEFVLKFRSEGHGGGPTGLLFEFIAAHIAALLEIPMPVPALIELDAALGDITPQPTIAQRISASVGLNFGTRYLTPGHITWVANDPVPLSLREVASEVMAFDALIDNADRRRDKPNLLWKGDALYVIDHELAFAFARTVLWKPQSWTARRLSFLRDHPLYAGLRGQTIDLRAFVGGLESLDDNEIERICESVPPEFGTTYLDRIAEHLRDARNHVTDLAEAVRRILR